MKVFCALVSSVLCTSALGQESPAEVTEAQVATYQTGMEMGCKNAGRRAGDPREKVEAFCNCVLQTLKDNASHEQWQKAYYYSRKRQEREEMQALSEHMPKVQACKPNAL